MQLSEKIQKIEASPIRKFNKIARKSEAEGKKIFWLNIGQPDIETPECFMEAINNYQQKVIAYAESDGETKLQNSISKYYKSYNINVEPEDVVITNGGSEAISMACTCILNEGDSILTAEPFYTNYRTFIAAAGGEIETVKAKSDEGFSYADLDKLEEKVTKNTKAIICTTPGNPTGNILSEDEMRIIGKFAIKHDLWIIADEVYREFCYDGREVTSFGMIPELQDRLIIIDSVSKRFSACGARIGALITKNEELMKSVIKLAQSRLCAPTIDQIGAASLFELPHSYYDKVRKEYEERRDAVYEEIMKVPNVVCRKPGGSFYMTIKLPIENAEDFLEFMLKEFDDKGETVMFTPAEGFYGTKGAGMNKIRVAYVLNQDEMRRSAELIRLGLEAYLKKKEGEK